MSNINRKAVKIERIVRKPGEKTKKVIMRKMPVLATVFEGTDDPLAEVDYDTTNLERSATNEMNAIPNKAADARRSQLDRFRVADDPEYWCCLVFQSREQRDQFLDLTGFGQPGDRYLNGLEVSRKLGVDIQPIELKPHPLRGKPKKYQGKEVL